MLIEKGGVWGSELGASGPGGEFTSRNESPGAKLSTGYPQLIILNT